MWDGWLPCLGVLHFLSILPLIVSKEAFGIQWGETLMHAQASLMGSTELIRCKMLCTMLGIQHVQQMLLFKGEPRGYSVLTSWKKEYVLVGRKCWVFCTCLPSRLLLMRTVRTSLMVQWIRICLAMLGMWVQSIVWEWSHMPWGSYSPWGPTTESVLKSLFSAARSHSNEKPEHHREE